MNRVLCNSRITVLVNIILLNTIQLGHLASLDPGIVMIFFKISDASFDCGMALHSTQLHTRPNSQQGSCSKRSVPLLRAILNKFLVHS
jgi:hypothetical protein